MSYTIPVYLDNLPEANKSYSNLFCPTFCCDSHIHVDIFNNTSEFRPSKNNFSGNQYSFKIVHDGKDPMILFKWDKESSYSVQAHGTCKGFTGGMCGSWDDKKNNDFTGPDGDVLKT